MPPKKEKRAAASAAGNRRGKRVRKTKVQLDEDYEDDSMDEDPPPTTASRSSGAVASSALAPAPVVSVASKLRQGHKQRPLWVVHDKVEEQIIIFLERSSPFFAPAQDFLIVIAEPVSRPKYVNEYKLTAISLYAAASIGLSYENIIETLAKFCKTEVPESVNDFIHRCTSTWGKVKLAVRENQYWIESSDYLALQELLEDPVIRESRVIEGTTEESIQRSQLDVSSVSIAGIEPRKPRPESTDEVSDAALVAMAESAEAGAAAAPTSADSAAAAQTAIAEDLAEYYTMLDDEESDDESIDVVAFQIKAAQLEEVQKRCQDLKYPLLAEYDFRNDKEIKDVESLTLKPTTTLRPYQAKALQKFFGRGRARSGVIVLPCGAGKTLTGIAAACTIRKRTLVLCKREVAVEQWVSEFERWSSVKPRVVTKFCSTDKERPNANGVIVCTYSMIGHSGPRSAETQQLLDFIRSNKWGLMILDEVQTAPARTFREILKNPCNCKLGLTATLLREDGKIKDLWFILGPKLFEANWLDLQRDGYIALVSCHEVRVGMTRAFFREYVSTHEERGIPKKGLASLRRLLSVMNPNKFHALEYLVREHEKMGDKIIVFCDRVLALTTFSQKLGRPMLYGKTPGELKKQIISTFKTDKTCQTLFCSTVADDSIDLPGANVLIQIDSHGGSERQEAQRLGRILRAKKNAIPGEINAYFYTVVSEDTKEMANSQKRQRFLVNQGYSYEVMKKLIGFEESAAANPFGYTTDSEQQNLLASVISNYMDDQDEGPRPEPSAIDVDDDLNEAAFSVRMTTASAAEFSGGVGVVYEEKRVATKPRGKFKPRS